MLGKVARGRAASGQRSTGGARQARVSIVWPVRSRSAAARSCRPATSRTVTRPPHGADGRTSRGPRHSTVPSPPPVGDLRASNIGVFLTDRLKAMTAFAQIFLSEIEWLLRDAAARRHGTCNRERREAERRRDLPACGRESRCTRLLRLRRKAAISQDVADCLGNTHGTGLIAVITDPRLIRKTLTHLGGLRRGGKTVRRAAALGIPGSDQHPRGGEWPKQCRISRSSPVVRLRKCRGPS